MPRYVSLLCMLGFLWLPFWWSAQEAPAPAHDITGIVCDDSGPLPGATVRLKGQSQFVLSDAVGRFRLPDGSRVPRVMTAKTGYFISGTHKSTRPLILNMRRVPSDDCEFYTWVDPTPDPLKPANCGNCHGTIHDEWQQSRHSRSATNRHFLDVYDELLREHPQGADVCSSCHAPTQSPGPFGSFDVRQAAQIPALSGIHCDFCHKVQGPGTGEFGLTHGRYQLSLSRPDLSKSNQRFFGPLDDAERGDDIPSAFQRDSRLCAACHEGIVFGVPVYTTYSEWQASPSARADRSCQSCHMKPTGTMTNIASGHGGIRRDPATLGNHRFFDGEPLDMLQRSLEVDASIHRTATSVEVVTNITATNVGHRVPTGFIDRQVILLVQAYASAELVEMKNGSQLPEFMGEGEANKPGKLYAKWLTDGKNDKPASFWQADPSTLQDTRLKPNETDRQTFVFPANVDRIVVRLVHRRFWKTTVKRKNRSDDERLILLRELKIP